MTDKSKTTQNNTSIKEFIASLDDEQIAKDSRVLIKMMQRISGHKPKKITVYLMDGTARYSGLLAKLGKHTTTGYCVYIKRLSDIELPILQQILQQSYENIKSQDGHIHQVLWQSEK
jgi:hypothetical protein